MTVKELIKTLEEYAKRGSALGDEEVYHRMPDTTESIAVSWVHCYDSSGYLTIV